MIAEPLTDDELDRGTTSVAPGTVRTCALSREQKPVDELMRFVVGPGDVVMADVRRKLPGRGLWITATREAVGEAVKRGVFARGFRRKVKAAATLPAETEAMLERAALDALAIAGKGGAVVTGFAKVETAIGRSNTAGLLHASDGSDDGKRKMYGALRREMEENGREIPVIEDFSGEQLDLALNRPNVVHAALLAGPGCETFLARVSRLARFRTEPPTGSPLNAATAQAPNTAHERRKKTKVRNV